MNQQTDLLNALKKRRKVGISQYEAMVLLGIGRLSERIRELQAKNHVIRKEWRKTQGSYGVKKYMRYWLVE